jgi:predicted GIY-YIG superfamily endonuclease
MRTALYRLYATDGTLLYVGVTDKLSVRFYSHSREKRWWPEVAGMRIAWYPNHAEAEEAERAAICSEDPVHNVRSTPRHGEVIRAAQRRSPEQMAADARRRQEWQDHLRRMFSERLAG